VSKGLLEYYIIGKFVGEKVFTGVFPHTCLLRRQQSREEDEEDDKEVALREKGDGLEHRYDRNLSIFLLVLFFCEPPRTGVYASPSRTFY